MGVSPAKTLYVGLDACDLHLAQRFAAEGTMPNLARLLDEGAAVETLGPIGYFVAGNWPTIWTGTTPSRHQFLCAGQVEGGTYDWRWVGPVGDPPPVWERLSAAGMRVASIDAPHARIATELNGIQLTEWGCHDRHAGPKSYPTSLLDDINATYGPHPIGTLDWERPHFAPCDMAFRAGKHRDEGEDVALYANLVEGHARKRALSLELLDRGDWDLFFTVIGETHCVGHQFWKVFDDTHPWHDATRRARLGADPIGTIYAAADATLGEHLARVSPDTTVYVHLNHGMQAHYDAEYLLEPLLWRLEQYASGTRELGWMSRAADTAMSSLPRSWRTPVLSTAAAARRRASSILPLGYFDEELPWRGRRRWWAQPNDTAAGSIRLNLEGREPNGRIRADQARATCAWLAERMREVINVDNGEPAIANIVLNDDCYERMPGDAFGDLLVEWNRGSAIETVWSPATGIVRRAYEGCRSGDHHRSGLLVAMGPGITPGRRAGVLRSIDVAPTLAASLDHDLAGVDGVACPDLVATASRSRAVGFAGAATFDSAPPAVHGRRRYPRRSDIPLDAWVETYALDLAGAHHHTSVAAQHALHTVHDLQRRIEGLEQQASIAQVTAWLRHVDVPESLLVSVVTPTRNRRDRLTRAVASVQAQSYPRWEMLVVDDASDDGTSDLLARLVEADDRIRPFRMDTNVQSPRAMNHALDHAKGDLVVYLDDDNQFDQDWLRAVVWAFTEYPETKVCYGARVVDDDTRHRRLDDRSLPIVQFLAWDRDEELRANRIDQNVLAHRTTYLRFDESLTDFMDWDFILQLTDDVDPLPLPVLATYYYTDIPDRMTNRFITEPELYRYVREKTIGRRRGGE